MRIWTLIVFILLAGYTRISLAQQVPAGDENIPFLMTFGNKAEPSWGDDDFCQTFFFLIPESYNDPLYIKIFDPDITGENDEVNGIFDTQTTFEIYGGEKCWSELDAQETAPTGNYKSGDLLAAKTFGQDARYDNEWYTFGPFNPTEGEWVEKWRGRVFKIIIEGFDGDDGNLYRMFLSTEENTNKVVEGANAFAYEYSFRMHNNPAEVSHIYPFVDDRAISVRQSNFDWDNDGLIRIVSVARKGQLSTISGDDLWGEDEFQILEGEHNTSLDMQLIKSKSPAVRNNNVVINVRNQYGELLPFYVIPLGGVPQYKYNIGARKQASK
jgi:hypothetical protein